MPLARIILSMSQRCSSKRRTRGGPRWSRMGGKPCCGRFMLFLRWRAVADRAACGGIIGAAHTLLSTMLTLPKSLPNRDALSRKSVNGWRTLPYICAVPVPNETNKEQIGTIAHSEQIKTNSAELWIWRGIKTPLLPNKPITADCPLYPQKQTSIERVGMSALCQKQTSLVSEHGDKSTAYATLASSG